MHLCRNVIVMQFVFDRCRHRNNSLRRFTNNTATRSHITQRLTPRSHRTLDNIGVVTQHNARQHMAPRVFLCVVNIC